MRSIVLSAREVRAVPDGSKTQFRQAVTLKTSTVNGSVSKSLWEQLYGWEKAWVDGVSSEVTFFGNGEYLHVPSKGANDGEENIEDLDCWYRVRCRLKPGDHIVLKVKDSDLEVCVEVLEVRAQRSEDGWVWATVFRTVKE